MKITHPLPFRFREVSSHPRIKCGTIDDNARFQNSVNGYSIKFSPFYENRVAVATAQNFGILGNGHVHVLDLLSDPTLPTSELAAYDTADGVYDIAWSESYDLLLVAAIADGSIKLYDLALSLASTALRLHRLHN